MGREVPGSESKGKYTEAGMTGIEPAISGLTGQRPLRLDHTPKNHRVWTPHLCGLAP